MRKALIESYSKQLIKSFGALKPPVEEAEPQRLYDKKDYAGMIACVKKILRLDVRVIMAVVKKGGLNAPAWVERPVPMPMYGTAAFRQTVVTVHLRKSFLDDSIFEEVVIAIAHELCHVVLDATAHVLQMEEEAVDLTAILLGFRDFYVTGCESVRKVKLPWWESLLGKERYRSSRTGYLSAAEVRYAAHLMTFGAPPG